MTMTAGRGRV